MWQRTILLAALCLAAVLGPAAGAWAGYPWLGQISPAPAGDIAGRFAPPPGFKRAPAAPGSFAAWLRHLPLRQKSWPVRDQKGRALARQGGRAAVVALDLWNFQECADSLIRLRAEYFWSLGRADQLCFKFTSGDNCCWKRWRRGWRAQVKGARVRWVKSAAPNQGRQNFRAFVTKVMEYAGTMSLHRDLAKVKRARLAIGDMIIQPGNPGHAVMVVDLATGPGGEKALLLAQGYMPVQEFHVVVNENSQAAWGQAGIAWYRLAKSGPIKTPDWLFDKPYFRRFWP